MYSDLPEPNRLSQSVLIGPCPTILSANCPALLWVYFSNSLPSISGTSISKYGSLLGSTPSSPGFHPYPFKNGTYCFQSGVYLSLKDLPSARNPSL